MALEATEELEPTTDEESVTDSPEALDTTETAPEGDEPLETDESLDETGQPRDAQGRFAQKATDTAAADEATQLAEVEPEPEETEGEPFSFKANKQDYPIEGALYIPGEGLAVPEEHVPFVKQLLSEGAYFRTNWRQLEQGYKAEIESLKSNPPKSEGEERATAMLAQLDQILSDPEKLIEFAARLEVEGPLLRERAEKSIYKSKLEAYESNSKTAKQKEQDELLSTQKDEAWTETFQTLKADKAYAGFTAEDWKSFEEEMSEIRDALFVVQNGETYLNEGQIQKAAQRRSQILSRVGKQATAVTKAAEFNARRQGKTPTPAARTVEAEAEEPAPPKNWDEWKRKNGLMA